MNKYSKKEHEIISDRKQTPDSLEECRKLIAELKARQCELELQVKEGNREMNNLAELNRGIVNHIELIIITTDPEGIITSFNPFAEKMLGYKAEEVLGNHMPLIFYDPSEFAETSESDSGANTTDFSLNFEQILKHNLLQVKQGGGVERTYIRKDGTRFNGLLTVSGIKDESDHTTGYVGVIVDITERKLVEEKLIESENENRAILSAVPDMLFKIREDGKILNYKNQTGNLLSDWRAISPKEKIDEIVSGEFAKRINEGIREALFTGKVVQSDFNFQVNKENHFYENRMIAISENEVLSMVRDITERKLTERYSIIHRDLGFSLAGTTTLDDALTLMIQSILQIEHVHAAGVYLINAQTKNFELIMHSGISSDFVKVVHQMESDDNRLSHIQKGEPVYGFCNEIMIDYDVFNRENLKQVGIIPIKHEEKVIGWVNIVSKATERLSDTLKIAVEVITAQIGGTLARIKSENELKYSQRNFQSIFDTINDFLFIFNSKGEIILANPIVEQRLGYTQDELRGMPVVKLHPPDRKEEVEILFHRILNGSLAVCSVPLYKRNGEFIPVETEFVRGKWDNTDVLYGISRDITERQKIEDQLKLQSLAFEAFALSIIITDIDGKIQWANSSFSELSGYNISEIIGKNPRQIVKSGQQDNEFYKNLWNTILSGKVWRGELVNKKKDGNFFPEELTITPVMDHSGKIINFIAIKIDVTRRKEMETALRRNEERWHFALEGLGDGAWDWNIKTNEVFFSDQWKTMLGYSVSEIENRLDEWTNRIHPDDLESCLYDLHKHMEGESEFFVHEYRMYCKDGSYIWILGRAKLIKWADDGTPLRIIGTHKDITARKLDEEQLRKSVEKEKELNDLKSRFIATASHEFRTPLASILLISDTLMNYQQKMDSAQIAARLLKIKNHVLHLTNIVNELLQLSKIQEGKSGFSPQRVDLISLCLSIIDEFNSSDLINKGHITFITPFKTMIARVDKRLMIQIINNLISNAIKYSQEVPTIFVELKLENEELILSVRDNGIGIPKQDIKHLFTPFFRAGNASAIQGNGLGLSIVRESMHLQGGKVSFVNNENKGSTFSLYFPENLISAFRYTN